MYKYLLGFGIIFVLMFTYVHYANAQSEQEKRTLEDRVITLEQQQASNDETLDDIALDIGKLDYRTNVLNKRLYIVETLNHLAKVTK